MYDQENPYSAYGGNNELSPTEILMRLNGLQSELRSTISDVVRDNGELREKQSQIVQTVDEIELSVTDIKSTNNSQDTKIGSLELRADGFDLSISDLNGSAEQQEATISLLSDKIELTVASTLKTTIDSMNGTIDNHSSSITLLQDKISLTVDSVLKQKIDGIDVLVSDNSSAITVLEDQVSLTVSSTLKTTIDGIESDVSGNTAQISILDGEIQNKVSSTDYNGNTIASLINQTATTIAIEANKINLTGYATFNSLSTQGQSTIHGGNITSQTISSDKIYGNLFHVGNGSTATKLELYTSDNNAHYIKSNQAAGFRVESSGSLSLKAGAGYGVYVTNAPLVCQGGFRVDVGTSQFDGAVSINDRLDVSSLYIAQSKAATESWANGQFASSGHNHTSINGYSLASSYSLKFPSSGWGHIIKNISTGFQFRNSSDSSNVTLYASQFVPDSLIELKKNIELSAKDGKGIVSSTPVYEYHWNGEDERAMKSIGLIYEESAPEVVDLTGRGIDLYAMVSVLWKAVQELIMEVDGINEVHSGTI